MSVLIRAYDRFGVLRYEGAHPGGLVREFRLAERLNPVPLIGPEEATPCPVAGPERVFVLTGAISDGFHVYLEEPRA